MLAGFTLVALCDTARWKALAYSNILCMLITLETSQSPMGWLKALASENMKDMSVTWETVSSADIWNN